MLWTMVAFCFVVVAVLFAIALQAELWTRIDPTTKQRMGLTKTTQQRHTHV